MYISAFACSPVFLRTCSVCACMFARSRSGICVHMAANSLMHECLSVCVCTSVLVFVNIMCYGVRLLVEDSSPPDVLSLSWQAVCFYCSLFMCIGHESPERKERKAS